MTPEALWAAESGEIENLIAAITPGGIEAQEKRGQIEQSFADTLPVDGTKTELQRKTFEALGFVFQPETTTASSQRDKLFLPVTFPKGWRKKSTRNDMLTDIIDETGAKRGSIFYKAAFYDRSASVRLE